MEVLIGRFDCISVDNCCSHFETNYEHVSPVIGLWHWALMTSKLIVFALIQNSLAMVSCI